MRGKRARSFKRNGNNLLPAKKTSVSGKSAGTEGTALPVITNCRPASASPLPTWLRRLLPAGAVAGWGLHPPESAAFARHTPNPDIDPPAQEPQARLSWRAVIGDAGVHW